MIYSIDELKERIRPVAGKYRLNACIPVWLKSIERRTLRFVGNKRTDMVMIYK